MTRNERIYALLRQGGLTEAGAFAMMGNWDCESNLEPGRLQGDFSSGRITSRDYVARVNCGALGKEAFAGDSKGFGLAQWTLAYRKRKLYEFWKASGLTLDSEVMQTRFALQELNTEGEYAGLFLMLKTSSNLYACTEAICKQYERPAYNNVDPRYQSAQRLQRELAGTAIDAQEIATVTPDQGGSASAIITPAIMPTHEYWPPRVICEGMKGPDVEVLCALLKAQEYGVNFIDSTFGSFLTERVKAYQTDKGLKPDGIVGPLTWGELLKIKSL